VCEGDCRTPTGGFTLWEASVELRVDVVGQLSAATFCDASDVSGKRFHFRLTHLHLSCGLGARYGTPVGPLRLDVGYRIPGAQVLGGPDPSEREPATFLGAPLAISLGVGEAF
jgi:outer membrane protein assembly factor BamA